MLNLRVQPWLKLVAFFLCPTLTVFSVIHEKESRTFTSSDGRQIEATLEGYNPISKEATLRMENGQKYDLALDRFSEKDQSDILEWREDYDASFVRIDFFTNRIDDGRVVFMLDSSGSMNGDRWEKMVRNMSEIIRRLDRYAQFNIILFGSNANVFKPDMVKATDDIKSEAEQWLFTKYPGGGTNLLSAIKAAEPFKKAAVYAILSDGYPSNEPNAIFDAITRNSKTNECDIRVFGVSYQSSERGEEFMQALSERFGGSFVRR